jgi:hypothetical protein
VIKGYVVGLKATFKYKNSSGDPLEVMFRFPVDDGMAVVGLTAKIGDRTIHGIVSIADSYKLLCFFTRLRRRKRLEQHMMMLLLQALQQLWQKRKQETSLAWL